MVDQRSGLSAGRSPSSVRRYLVLACRGQPVLALFVRDLRRRLLLQKLKGFCGDVGESTKREGRDPGLFREGYLFTWRCRQREREVTGKEELDIEEDRVALVCANR